MAVMKNNRARKLACWALNLGLLGAILVLGTYALRGAVKSANLRADIKVVQPEAWRLYDAMQKYYERHASYPASYAGLSFDLETLDPLTRRGYYRGHLLTKLQGNAVDAYGSPDDRGPNQEFWIEMSLADDPSIRVLVVNSDDAPMGGGHWLNGVFLFKNDSLENL